MPAKDGSTKKSNRGRSRGAKASEQQYYSDERRATDMDDFHSEAFMSNEIPMEIHDDLQQVPVQKDLSKLFHRSIRDGLEEADDSDEDDEPVPPRRSFRPKTDLEDERQCLVDIQLSWSGNRKVGK
ncbi:unnamed protein product [Caenorhabditis auriculariae]|uniref:Uncharacterized protein n=1 Tax=Caenorhabditis auriculariae TaxID=2777116 RepID=A0A8S1GNB4_9PELO|nr:unnamed protein product [Caenorhabditis auriculariae]